MSNFQSSGKFRVEGLQTPPLVAIPIPTSPTTLKRNTLRKLSCTYYKYSRPYIYIYIYLFIYLFIYLLVVFQKSGSQAGTAVSVSAPANLRLG